MVSFARKYLDLKYWSQFDPAGRTGTKGPLPSSNDRVASRNAWADE